MQTKRWLRKSKNIFFDSITAIGIFWLFVEIFSYSTNGASDSYLKSVSLFLIIFIIILIGSIIKNKPKTSFKYNLRNKDNYIQVKVGDAFQNKGSLVIPVNNEFDMSLGGNVLKSNSIQSQVIKKYYSSKIDHINTDIEKEIAFGTKYDIGKTIEIENSGKKFYLVANSIKKENNRVKSEVDDFIQTLNGLWEYLALESGRNTNVTIPLMNTQHGRDSYLTRKSAIKEIINSYIESSKDLNICENLIISIYPDDLIKGNIDLNEINEYLRFQCKHYRKLTLEQKTEDPMNGSKIIEIQN